jgi:hypothetical protein
MLIFGLGLTQSQSEHKESKRPIAAIWEPLIELG